jgi:hypothetical protein
MISFFADYVLLIWFFVVLTQIRQSQSPMPQLINIPFRAKQLMIMRSVGEVIFMVIAGGVFSPVSALITLHGIR